MHFDLVDMRLMVNIAESNLTHGARRSHLSLPAASIRIKNLEDALGAKLLHRASQGVTLTPAGETYVHHSRAVLLQVEHLSCDLQQYVKGVKGNLRVSANTTAVAEFLPAILRAYLFDHPDVNVDLREHPSQNIVRAVSEGATDIGIVAGNVCTAGLEVLPYREDRLVLAMAPTHPLAKGGPASFADTLDFDQIGLSDTSAIHAFLDRAAAALRRTARIRTQVGNFEAMCRMAEAGVGIGILPESAARRHARTMEICVIPLSDEWALRNLRICIRSLESLPPFAQELVDLLVADGAMHQMERDSVSGTTHPRIPSLPSV